MNQPQVEVKPEVAHGGLFKRHKKDLQDMKNKIAILEAENEKLKREAKK